jgi:trans-aconitate methyltransferase
MLEELAERFQPPPVLGNVPAVRTWLGPFAELPPHQGRADVIFFNSVFGNLPDPYEALLKSTLLLNPGGKVVISHPLGVFHAAKMLPGALQSATVSTAHCLTNSIAQRALSEA